jgi:DNA-binding NtrC family response regulator
MGQRSNLRHGTRADVLVVDDNADFQQTTARIAEMSNCRVFSARTLSEARELASRASFDLMLVDIHLPDGNGLDLMNDIDLASHGEIAIVTGNPSIDTAVRAVRSPAVEYLSKPIATNELLQHLERAYRRALDRTAESGDGLDGFVGESAPMQALYDEIRRVAPLDINVLIHGESGTGKELVARAIHRLSHRAGRFVSVNCGALTADLLGSHLFGHERGSFTGAVQTHAGYFEQADGGTLFLDEISEMPIGLQVYLLRVLESRSFVRVGGSRDIPSDVRVIAATNRHPEQAVRAGTLRADLYYRLAEFPINVPPLRERDGDIALLSKHFLHRLNTRFRTHKAFAADALTYLSERAWPGNVREL